MHVKPQRLGDIDWGQIVGSFINAGAQVGTAALNADAQRQVANSNQRIAQMQIDFNNKMNEIALQKEQLKMQQAQSTGITGAINTIQNVPANYWLIGGAIALILLLRR